MKLIITTFFLLNAVSSFHVPPSYTNNKKQQHKQLHAVPLEIDPGITIPIIALGGLVLAFAKNNSTEMSSIITSKSSSKTTTTTKKQEKVATKKIEKGSNERPEKSLKYWEDVFRVEEEVMGLPVEKEVFESLTTMKPATTVIVVDETVGAIASEESSRSKTSLFAKSNNTYDDDIENVDDMGRIQYSATEENEEVKSQQQKSIEEEETVTANDTNADAETAEEKEEETTTPITATDNDVLEKEEKDVVDEQLLESTSTETPPEAAEQNDDEVEEEEQMPERPTFNSIGLSPEILSAVRAQPDWFFPTPVQALGIPQILSGPDFIWCESPTGSGKTAAFALPLLQQLYYRKKEENKNTKKKNKKKGGSIASLILCPTRELAMQVSNVLSNLSHNTGGNRDWDIMTLHGGVPIDPQIAALGNAIRDSRTIDVVVATPGRLVDVLTYYDNDSEKAAKAALNRRLLDALDSRGKTDASLSLGQIEKLSLDRIDDDGRGSLPVLFAGLRHLVIDEADRLLGKAFEKEVNSCLDLLLATDKGYDNIDKIKTWIFSATFPKSIEPRVNNVFQRLGSSTPLRIFLSNSNRIVDTDVSSSLQKRLDKTRGATTLQEICSASTINHRAIQLEKSQRTLVLRKLLDENPEWDRVLVFVSTRYASEHVSLKLRRNGILSAELHGKLDQEARDRRLRAFSKGKIRVLLATDVASRGLDVVGLPAVVNYDLPRSTADFVHRTGRTGRAGKQGTAITLVTAPGESHLKLIEKRHLSQPIPREKLSGFEPDEIEYQIQYSASEISPPGTQHSSRGLAYDKMNGGIKGNRKSKKDRLREKAAVVEMNSKQEQL